MKKLWIQLLCVVLTALMTTVALAEGLSLDIEAGDQAQTVVEVLDGDLFVPVAPQEALPEESDSNAVPQEPTAPQEESSQEEEQTPEEEAPQEEEEPLFGDPIAAKKIKITKSAKKTVYLGIPYVLNVSGGIKSVKSSAKKVASASKDGTLTLKKNGNANLTIQTQTGKKLTVKLTVKQTPAPGNLKVKTKNETMKLSWSAAKYATRHLVQMSSDGKSWTDLQALDAGRTSLNVTSAVSGPTWFRVVAILGDHFGGATSALQVLGPLTNVRVFCQESYKWGPISNMNVAWKGCAGASGYEIYHTLLPSEDYTLIGTTQQNYYPVTRHQTKLDAYQVKPIFGDLDLPASDPVTLWSGMQSNVLPPSKLTSSSGIILVVNKKAQVVTAYVRDADGKYTIPLRHMICSSGKDYDRTRNGTYKLKDRKGEWYRYPSGCYIRWPSIYRDGYYFHSVLFKSKEKIYTGTIDKLGTRQSLGCIRLKVLDARWIYKNCPKGTTVYICDGNKRDKLRNALKPKTVKISGFD